MRRTEELVQKMMGQRPQSETKPPPQPDVSFLEERLRQRLGIRVSLHPRKKGGTLVIHYYSDEELDQLILRILGQSE